MSVPYAELETIFLDAGNTLVGMDFVRIAQEACKLGIESDAEALRAAEAAARPGVSERAARRGTTEGADAFLSYVVQVLERLPQAVTADTARELARALGQVHAVGALWTEVLPGVPEALVTLRDAGLKLVVVSNSDGSVEQQLQDAGLGAYFEHVIDSHHVGHEKPDPRIFQHALARSGARSGRTLHIGDLFDVDVAGARAAGIHAALLDPRGEWERRPGIDCILAPDLATVAHLLVDARQKAGS